ncbi:hypothetical protein [Rothia sp. ND6WE1A]|uniref:hypothetical protein n=1 Tax=Rothia sp. ND6WE1A TaxID=1848190 RepID=UPI000836BC05|nr:hypothetical protein [Rothia sp. ND6WE1A]
MGTVEAKALECVNNLLTRVDTLLAHPSPVAVAEAKAIRRTASALMVNLLDSGYLSECTPFYRHFVQTHALVNIRVQQVVDLHAQPTAYERYLSSDELEHLLSEYCPDLLTV